MFLKVLFKVHRFLLCALLLLIILMLEVYFIDILPFIGGNVLLVVFLVLSVFFLLFYLILLLVGLPCALFNKTKVATAELPKQYGLRFVGGVVAWLFSLAIIVFQPFHKVEVVNKTSGAIDNVVCNASFENSAVKKPLESLGVNKTKNFTLRGLGGLIDIVYGNKVSVIFLQADKQKWMSRRSSFLRTKVVIRDYTASNPKEMDCEETMLDYFFDFQYDMTMNVNLCNELMDKDTIALSYISNSPVGYIVLNTPYENRIKKVERVLHWYPSVWSGMGDNLMQYTKLTGLKYETTEEIKLLTLEEERKVTSKDITYGNVIGYKGPYRSDYDLSIFEDVSGNDVMKHLRAELNKPKRGYEPLTNAEIDKWMGFLDEYDKGSFLNDGREHFRVHTHDIYLRVTFEGDDGDFVKVLHNWVQVGN